MFKRFFILISALSAGVMLAGIWSCDRSEDTVIDPGLFAVTAEDDDGISREFIEKIRAGVGDEKASRASKELDFFIKKKMVTDTMNWFEIQKVYEEYIHYLERLRRKALNAAADGMQPAEREAFLQKEQEWLEKFLNGYDYEIRSDDGTLLVDIEPLARRMRVYLNHVRYLESPPERRAELDRFQGLKTYYVRDYLHIENNEVRRETPLAVIADYMATDDEDELRSLSGKNYIEEIATMPVEFCREVRIGEDLFQMGIMIPNNDILTERSTWGIEVILVVWRNGWQYAVFYLPCRSRVQEMNIHGTQVSIRYLQTDDVAPDIEHKKDLEQTYTVDFTYGIYAPVRITNWLDYFMDGLGNVHLEDCCREMNKDW